MSQSYKKYVKNYAFIFINNYKTPKDLLLLEKLSVGTRLLECYNLPLFRSAKYTLWMCIFALTF